MSQPSGSPPIAAAGSANVPLASRLAFIGVAAISGVINILALTGAIYMLQIYDRVIPSRSIPTLVGLTVLMVALYAAFGVLDYLRTRITGRIGLQIDARLRDGVFKAVARLPLKSRSSGDGLQPIRDLDAVRAFLMSPAPNALFDLPWIPVYLLVVYLLHPWLGLTAMAGALLLLALAAVTEFSGRAPSRAAAQSNAARLVMAEAVRRNSEVVRAMGLEQRLALRWQDANATYLDDQVRAAHAGSGLGAVSRFIRLLLQSAILGLGAYLVIIEQATAGVIIAASIAMGRALAPMEVVLAHWRGFLAARQSLKRLRQLLPAIASDRDLMALPKPRATLTAQGLSIAPPGSSQPVIQNVSFQLEAGAGLAVIGPSGSGKSSLARALVGAWSPLPRRGTVRLDGAALDQWSPEALGNHIGYLSQEIELFDGTVAENISRFDPTASSDEIVAAATLAGVHGVILGLADGYGTRIGENGAALSAGQRQRLALARALFRDPFLVVLDEPNSNLDLPGDLALAEAIKSVRARRGIVVVIAHRPSALAGLDQVLVMNNGLVQAMGPKDEILRKVGGLAPAFPAVNPDVAAAQPGAGPVRGPELRLVTDEGQPR